LLDINFDELKQLAAGNGCRGLALVIVKDNSVRLMRELVGNDFELVFGRSEGLLLPNQSWVRDRSKTRLRRSAASWR
jgi:hypothetical protein